MHPHASAGASHDGRQSSSQRMKISAAPWATRIRRGLAGVVIAALVLTPSLATASEIAAQTEPSVATNASTEPSETPSSVPESSEPSGSIEPTPSAHETPVAPSGTPSATKPPETSSTGAESSPTTSPSTSEVPKGSAAPSPTEASDPTESETPVVSTTPSSSPTPEDKTFAPRSVSGGNYCTAGVYTISQVGSVHGVSTQRAISDDATGSFRDAALDALAVTKTGTHAYAASQVGQSVNIQRMSGQSGDSEQLSSVTVAFAKVSGGAINATNTHYYFGGYTHAQGTTFYELYAYDLAANSLVGQVARVKMPTAATSSGIGDLVFDSRGDLSLLWSSETGDSAFLASVPSTEIPTTAGSATVSAGLLSTIHGMEGVPLNGLATGSLGGTFVQGSDGTDTTIGSLNRSTGQVTGMVTKTGFVGSDLASCGVSTSIVLQKDIKSRAQSSDQFKFDLRTSGSTDDLTSATTVGSTLGIQNQSAGPLGITVGTVYTLGEVGVSGASLGDYDATYRCNWTGQAGEPFATGTLSYNSRSGRAQRTLPEIPAANEGMTLNCVVTNTAKQQLQPKLELRTNLQSARKNATDQFVMELQTSGQTTVSASSTTTGNTTGVQPGVAGPIVAEIGKNYTISQRMALGSTSTIGDYTVTYECRWSGDNTLHSRGALTQGANNRTQTLLSAIPGDRSGQTLGCTMNTRVKPASGLICTPGTVYAVNNTTNRVSQISATSVGNSVFTVPAGISNAFAINLDGTEGFVAGGSGTTVNIAKWSAGNDAATTIAGLSRATGQTGSINVPATVAGAVDPTTGIYYFGGYSAGNPATLVVYAYAGGSTYWQAGSIHIPNSYNVSTNNGDLTFDARGNLYMVWSPGGTNALNNTTVLARLDSAQLPRTMPTNITTNTTAVRLATLTGPTTQVFNGMAFDANGELFVSHSAGYNRLNPSTGALIGTQVTQANIVDLASCGLPPTMRLQKDIADRSAATDQFTLGIYVTGRTNAVQQFTTTGSTTGVQSQVAGPAVVTVGQQYTIREGAANTTNLDTYISSFTCRWSDSTEVFADGVLNVSGNLRQATLPAVPAGKGGQILSCTIVNEPVFDTTVMVSKELLDVHGQNPAPGSGWEISAEISGGTGGAVFPSNENDPTTKRTVASGSLGSPWGIRYPTSRTTTNLTVSETQQPGYEVAGGVCMITPPRGAVRTVKITSERVAIDNLGPGNRVECTFQNKPIAGSALWQKVNEGTGPQRAHLSGSAWSLSGPSVPRNTIVVDCTKAPCPSSAFSDRDPRPGFLEIGELEQGKYTLVEQKSPAGYVRDQTPHSFQITVQKLKYEFADPFVNRQQSVPSLPFTGGLSSDMFLLGGGALVAVSMGSLWYFLRRNRRHGQS